MMMMAMANQMQTDSTEGKKKSTGLFNEGELRKKASTMGEGVTYSSGKKIPSEEGEGYEVVYKFRDINKVRMGESPDIQPFGDMQKEKAEKPEREKKYITFEFTKGLPATLVVYVPQMERKKPAKREEKKKEEDQEAGLEMAKMMLKDLKISSVIEVQGSIVETNATFQDGSKVTLVDVDMGKLLNDEGLAKRAMEYQDVSPEEAKELMKKYQGLKLELNREKTIRFK